MIKVFEKAKWIANSTDMGDRSHMLRKCFKVKRVPKKATLYCCGLGQAVYFINGENVTEDVYVTHFTQYNVSVIYNTFDITTLIKEGYNAIAVHLGNGWFNDICTEWGFDKAVWRSYPKLLLEIVMEYDDNNIEIICSDSSWKACDGPVVFNRMRSGEIFDARLCPKGWKKVDCDETGWHNAHLCEGPSGKLKDIDMPPIRVVDRLKPKKIGTDLYDFGCTLSGRVRITVSGIRGVKVIIKYGEILLENNEFDDNVDMYIETKLKQSNQYILSGEGKEEYAPEFVYHGFRYVKIIGDVDILDITAECIHNDFKCIGNFECGDDTLNAIHKASNRATLTNYMDIPTDCPHREQNGWTADASVSCQQALMNFDMKKAYQKWLDDFKDAQRESGQIPVIIPSSGIWGYDRYSSPAWDSSIIFIPWNIYQNTKDLSIIKDMWNSMKLYMKYIWNLSEEYTVEYGVLGDWCPPEKNYVKYPKGASDTAIFYRLNVIMSKCCKLIGEADTYLKMAEKIKKAYRERYLNNFEFEKSQTFIACGLYFGLYNEDEVPIMAKKLSELVKENDYHISCGIIGTKCIFGALAEHGYNQTVYKMVTNPTYPSYAYWIGEGYTSLCESWEGKESKNNRSLNHHMFSEVDFWMYKYLAGINIDENGITIKPEFVDEVKWVRASHCDISVYWDEKVVNISSKSPITAIIDGKEYRINKGNLYIKR